MSICLSREPFRLESWLEIKKTFVLIPKPLKNGELIIGRAYKHSYVLRVPGSLERFIGTVYYLTPKQHIEELLKL